MMLTELAKSRWMIVDDEQDNTWLLHHILSAAGLDVVAFNDPHEALRALKEDPKVSVVVTDFNMPNLNGDELRKAARAARPEVKMVLMTANPDWDDTQALLKGFNAFLPKPLALSDVLNLAHAINRPAFSLQAA